jgi:hypothetical protein
MRENTRATVEPSVGIFFLILHEFGGMVIWTHPKAMAVLMALKLLLSGRNKLCLTRLLGDRFVLRRD